ncbi:MATE family efflux transporter [bacterium]|nr:MATE family efflux transporter [bacterium]
MKRLVNKNNKMFAQYVLPATIAMLIIGSYSIIDTMFIGRSAGELGLAAVAITWPVVFVFMAIGNMVSAGAAIIISQSRGAGDIARARKVFGNMMFIMMAASVIMGLIMGQLLPDILIMLGAKEEFLPLSLGYGNVMIWFNFASMLATSMPGIVRNDGRPVVSMWLTILGLGLNIILDYIFIFVFNMGVVGAAYATILSQTISGIAGLTYFATKYTKLRYGMDMLHIKMKYIRDIFVSGIPALGTELSLILMLLTHNYQAMKYGDTSGLAAYTFVGAVESVGSLLMTGLSLGIVLLVAYLYGRRHNTRQNIMGNMGYALAFIFGTLITLIAVAGHNILPGFFNLHGDVAALAGHALVISSTAFILLGVVRVAGYYYQATGKIATASLIIYGDAFVVLPACLFILPLWFGLNGVWMALPVSRIIMFAVVVWLWFLRGNPARRRLNPIYKRMKFIKTRK